MFLNNIDHPDIGAVLPLSLVTFNFDGLMIFCYYTDVVISRSSRKMLIIVNCGFFGESLIFSFSFLGWFIFCSIPVMTVWTGMVHLYYGPLGHKMTLVFT